MTAFADVVAAMGVVPDTRDDAHVMARLWCDGHGEDVATLVRDCDAWCDATLVHVPCDVEVVVDGTTYRARRGLAGRVTLWMSGAPVGSGWWRDGAILTDAVLGEGALVALAEVCRG